MIIFSRYVDFQQNIMYNSFIGVLKEYKMRADFFLTLA